LTQLRDVGHACAENSWAPVSYSSTGARETIAGSSLHRKCPRVESFDTPGCVVKASAPLALQRAAARLMEGAEIGAVLLPLPIPAARLRAVLADLQRVVLRNTRSDCEPGQRAAPKSARAYFADEPIRDSEAKEVRQAIVLVLDHWRHAQMGETHSVGWYAARLGLEKRQIERYYVALAATLALHLHQPPSDAEGVPRGPSGHPYNVTTWVMGLSVKTMREPRPAEVRPPVPEARQPLMAEGNAAKVWALKLVGLEAPS